MIDLNSHPDWWFTALSGAFAVGLWLITGLAFLSHLAGNLTAINAIIGAGFMAVLFTAFTVLFLIDHVMRERSTR